MGDIKPIRPEIEIKSSDEREVVDYLIQRVRQFREESGCCPTRVAIVLTADTRHGLSTAVNTWALDGTSQYANCAVAAMLLTERAMNG